MPPKALYSQWFGASMPPKVLHLWWLGTSHASKVLYFRLRGPSTWSKILCLLYLGASTLTKYCICFSLVTVMPPMYYIPIVWTLHTLQNVIVTIVWCLHIDQRTVFCYSLVTSKPQEIIAIDMGERSDAYKVMFYYGLVLPQHPKYYV